MIGGVTVTLPFGKLFGLYNVKWLYIISLVLFMVGSALCGAAPTMNAMIVGRVIAGIGGNGMYLGVITLLSVNTTPQERPLYLSMVYVSTPLDARIMPSSRTDVLPNQWPCLWKRYLSGSYRWWCLR